jgi:hypothetical protein
MSALRRSWIFDMFSTRSCAVLKATWARWRTSDRPALPLGASSMSRGDRPDSHDLAGRLVETLPVVRQVDLDGRGARRDDAEEVARVNQPLRDPVEQVSHARRLARLEMRVVYEDHEDTARGVVRRA